MSLERITQYPSFNGDYGCPVEHGGRWYDFSTWDDGHITSLEVFKFADVPGMYILETGCINVGDATADDPQALAEEIHEGGDFDREDILYVQTDPALPLSIVHNGRTIVADAKLTVAEFYDHIASVLLGWGEEEYVVR